MSRAPQPDPAPTDAEVARYIADLAASLRDMARGRPELHALAYVLDMARVEGKRLAGVRTEPVRRWPSPHLRPQ